MKPIVPIYYWNQLQRINNVENLPFITGNSLLVGLELPKGHVPGRGEGRVRCRREGDGPQARKSMRHLRCQEESLIRWSYIASMLYKT